MKRQFVILCSLILGVVSVYSQQISFNEAEQIARNFFGKSQKSVQSCADISVVGNDTLYYVFNANNGFVVVSADKKAIPILAYSDAGIYDTENVIPPVKMWLDYYQSQLSAIRKDAGYLPEEKVRHSWEALENPSKTHKSTNTSTEPLLTSKWGQGKNFNYYCPLDDSAGSDYNNRAIAGCVATAMAQIIYYFRFPEVGIGEHSYQSNRYGSLSVNFSETQYKYDAMQDKPAQINWAASLLTYHCGVGVNMNYGYKSSGASSYRAASALRNYFKYSPQTKIISRYDSTVTNWDSIIISHLDRKIPLYYSGTDTAKNVGHAFICDAYEKDTNDNYWYHFNWGWDGYSDGWFYTSPLIEDNSIAYHVWQQIIINAYPDTSKYDYPNPVSKGQVVLTEETGSFTDGSIYDCPSGIDYKWIIRPDVAPIQSIKLELSFKLAEGDSIFVTSADGKINRTFTNDVSSATITTSSNQLVVRLMTTNDTLFSKRIKGNYVTSYTKHCSNLGIRYTDNQGSFEDGSGAYKYNNLAKCLKLIRVNGSSITLYFSRFETEKDYDILSIYDYTNSKNPALLLKLSGSLTDFDSTEMTFNTNALMLEFITDGKIIDNGWELSYATDVPRTGIINFNKENNFIIYPNPTTDYLYVKTENNISTTRIQLYDIYGKLIQEQSITNEQSIIDMSNLASGIYVLKIKDSDKTITTKKIIKQ